MQSSVSFNVVVKKSELYKLGGNVFGYLYRIKDNLTGMSYIGIRYSKGLNIKKDLGVKYFSSSEVIKYHLFEAGHSLEYLRKRFSFEIRKIFLYNHLNMLYMDESTDIIYTRKRLTYVIRQYEESLLRKLKAGDNPFLYNKYSSYSDLLRRRETMWSKHDTN